RSEHVREVHEDALRGLRAQVVQARFVVDHTEVGLHQTGERFRLCVLTLVAAVRARHAGESALGGPPLARLVVFDEVIGAETSVAAEALHEGVTERRNVTGGLPHPLGKDDRGVEADHVAAATHERLPPLTADVLFELGAEGPVVPSGARTAVDLTCLENEPAVAGEADDLVKTGLFGHGGSNGRMRRECAREHGRSKSIRVLRSCSSTFSMSDADATLTTWSND